MAQPILGVLGQSAPAATTSTTIYTVDTGRRAVVSTIAVAETGGVDAKIRINVGKAGAATAVGNAIAHDLYLPKATHYGFTEGITLAAGDKLYVYSDTGGVTFTVFGEESDVPA